jgi:hypothetical protein
VFAIRPQKPLLAKTLSGVYNISLLVSIVLIAASLTFGLA